MEKAEAVQLIRQGVIAEKSNWADLGCGDGMFTLALSSLISRGSVIYAVDSNSRALAKVLSVPQIKIEKIKANFEKDHLSLSNLDGILMANSIHFVKDKHSFIQKAKAWLKP